MRSHQAVAALWLVIVEEPAPQPGPRSDSGSR